MSKIGFIGTDVMGKSVIRNMTKNNLSVNVYNQTKNKTDDSVAEGTVWYNTPKVIAEASDTISTTVGFPLDAKGVYFNETGVFQANPTGKIVVDLTTSTPTLAEEIAKKAAEAGAHALNALVSGGDLDIKNGTLTIIVDSNQEGYGTVLPIFKAFGETFMLHGSAGKEQYTRMASRLMIADTMTGLTEMLVCANTTELTLEEVLEAAGGGSAASWSLSNYGPRVLKEDYTPGFFVRHPIKDLKIVLDGTKKLDLPLPTAQEVIELYESLIDKGFEDGGTQALIKPWWTGGKQPTDED